MKSDIFIIEWRALEIRVKDHSRSLKMRHSVEHTTTYQSAIVRVALSCTIFDIFDVEEYRDLEIRVVGNSLCEFMHDMYI